MIAPLPKSRIDVREPDGEPAMVRSPDMYMKDQAAAWLESIYPSGWRENYRWTNGEELPEAYLARAASYLTPFQNESGTIIGWAALSFDGQGFRAEKGLCSQQPQRAERLASGDVNGVLPGFGTRPGRNTASKPKEEILNAWLSSQLAIFRPEDFSCEEQVRVASSIYNLGGDPQNFAIVAVSMERLSPFYLRSDYMFNIDDFFRK